MKKARNTAKIMKRDEELDELEIWGGSREERTIVLKAMPRSRKVQLMAQGAKEIRCGCCGHIKPIAGAEEWREMWICGDCLPPAMRAPNSSEEKGSSRRRRGIRQEAGVTVRL